MLFKVFVSIILAIIVATPLLAQSTQPTVEVILSTDQAKQGDTVYADVVIRNGRAVAGVDIGITTGNCLRVVERQPGNYLPTTSEEGGFSAFSELTDHSTRLAASIIDRGRIVSGDGTFFRAVMEVICDEAVPEVTVTYALLSALADPDSGSNELVGFALEAGNLGIVNDTITVQPGAVVAEVVAVPTIVPLADAVAAATTPAISQNTILIAALAVMAVCLVGIVTLLVVYRRQRRAP